MAMEHEVGRVGDAEQALVNEARAGLHPSGFDPSRSILPRDAAVQRLAARVGFVLRMARLHRRVSLEELAQRIGEKAGTLRNLERGELYHARLTLISDIAHVLDFDIDFDVAPAIAIEAATAGETGTGSTEGESAGRDSDIAQPKSGPSHD